MGNRSYLIESFLDISEQKKLETQLQQAQKMEAIGTLTGGIAHDFNNILGVILGNTELAQLSMAVSDEAYAKLEVTKEATFRAKQIVNQLLSFSRRTTTEKTTVDVNQITRETINFVRALIPSTIDIQQQFFHEPCIVLANPTQIHQVLINLSVNASHAVDEETGTIRLGVSKTEVGHGEFDHFPKIGGATFVEIIVNDNGHGVAPEIQDRIFDPYFTTKEVGKGTGMGLAVVMGIVQDHGGAIGIDSQPNQGTTIRVVLPLADLDPDTSDVSELHSYRSGKGERILIIDDEELLVELGKDLLERRNYRVEGYMDASAAMERFRANPQSFDLIISDMTMPKMSGSRIVEEARQIRPDIPVIICSGYSKHMDEARADALGCQYIQKPVDMKILSDTVRKALDNRSI
jgi:nitrogen-specific signal transduction histidine kinase/ActR/RegA family two-component response regulator